MSILDHEAAEGGNVAILVLFLQVSLDHHFLGEAPWPPAKTGQWIFVYLGREPEALWGQVQYLTCSTLSPCTCIAPGKCMCAEWLNKKTELTLLREKKSKLALIVLSWTQREHSYRWAHNVLIHLYKISKISKSILWPQDVKSQLIGKDPDASERLRTRGEGGNRGWDGWMDHWFTDMSLSKLQQIVKDREGWCAVVHGVTNSQTKFSKWTT